MKTHAKQFEQKALDLVCKKKEKRHVLAKWLDIVSVRMVKESSLLYKHRVVRSPEDGYELIKLFLGDIDCEYFVLVYLDTNNQPTTLNVCQIVSLNSFIVDPREIMKLAILSNGAGIKVGHNHPSGESPEDINVTIRIASAGEVMGISPLDHIILDEDSELFRYF